MALADEIRALAAKTQTAYHRVLDYYYQSQTVWGLIEEDVRRTGRTFTSQNVIKGTVADQTEITSRINSYFQDYLTPATFQQLVTIFEAYFFDLLALWLAARPGILFRRQVDLETVLKAADKTAVLQLVVERELNEVKYRRVADWFEYMRKLVNIAGPTEDEIASLAEIKAGRDILVHAQGIVNAVYIAKAGSKARYVVGDILELPEPYFRTASDLMEKVTVDIAAAIAAKA